MRERSPSQLSESLLFARRDRGRRGLARRRRLVHRARAGDRRRPTICCAGSSRSRCSALAVALYPRLRAGARAALAAVLGALALEGAVLAIARRPRRRRPRRGLDRLPARPRRPRPARARRRARSGARASRAGSRWLRRGRRSPLAAVVGAYCARRAGRDRRSSPRTARAPTSRRPTSAAPTSR